MTERLWVRRLALGGGLLLAGALSLAAPPATTVEFAPAVVAKMRTFGDDQREPLQQAIVAALAREAAKTPAMAALEIAVTVEDVAPTRPTPAQLAADPAMSPTRSKFLGGAQLRAEVRDADHHTLTVVNHSYFAPTLRLGSRAFDPWADARLSIDQFAVKLGAVCRALPRG
jgi:hypothetical protein